jgi:hypothetical protein
MVFADTPEQAVASSKPELKPMKLYMPLHADIYERNQYGDLEEHPGQLDGRYLTEYEEAIFNTLVKYRMPEEQERGLMNWYREGGAVDEKVRSAVFSIEAVDGTLYGTVECMVTEDLTADEMETFKDYISGQASDGWGEGFEQQDINLPDKCVLNVHLWDSGDRWSLMTEDEFQLSQIQEYGGMQYGHQI